MKRGAALFIAGAICAGLGWRAPAPAAEPPDAAELDRGTAALYYLLNVEGRPRTLDEVRAALPACDDRGYSSRELADSAGSLGLEVAGGRSLDLEKAPDRPIIAFIKRPEHGHDVLLRPVGHTGRLVRVLDGREAPEVLDMAAFRAEQGWTGLCLVPERGPAWSGPLTLVAAIVVAVSWMAVWIRHRRGAAGVQS